MARWEEIYIQLDELKGKGFPSDRIKSTNLVGKVTKVECVRYLEAKAQAAQQSRGYNSYSGNKPAPPSDLYTKTVELHDQGDLNKDGFLSILECFCLLPELEKTMGIQNPPETTAAAPGGGRGYGRRKSKYY